MSSWLFTKSCQPDSLICSTKRQVRTVLGVKLEQEWNFVLGANLQHFAEYASNGRKSVHAHLCLGSSYWSKCKMLPL